GAATIFANYDGVDKHRTTVGKQVRVGSDSVLVAPVTLRDGSATGARTVVREDVPPGALAVSAVSQRSGEGWTRRRRAGTAAEGAARAALGPDGDAEDAVSASPAAEDHKEREQRRAESSPPGRSDWCSPADGPIPCWRRRSPRRSDSRCCPSTAGTSPMGRSTCATASPCAAPTPSCCSPTPRPSTPG